MIDYDKLKMAHELADKLASQDNYWCSIDIALFSKDNNPPRYFFAGCLTTIETTDIDDLIAKLKELTKKSTSKPKYSVGDKCFIYFDFDIYEVTITGLTSVFDDYYVVFPNGAQQIRSADGMYATKIALIEAQIEYWNDLKNEEIILCHNPSMETAFVGDAQGFNKDFCLSLEGQQKIKQGFQELIWTTNSEAHNKEWLLINENNDFKVGDEIWRFRSNSYHSDTHKPSDLYLESFIIERFDDSFVIAESGEYLDEDEIRDSYKSKKDAINAMIKYMEGLQR